MTTGHVLPDEAGFPVGVVTHGPTATAGLGARVADLLRGGEILLLHGGLGAGKTCFVQGLCRGLDVTGEVVSPTFTLVNTYEGRFRVHHLDFYRIESTADLVDIGVPDLLDEVADGAAVIAAEWPGPLLGALGTLPFLELLALPLPAVDSREWRLRGRPEPAAAWRGIFAPGDGPC
ncbi:MAG: tRNA (adenosine(37)-N6)-threonylcarbamoyltransferase complex ATPase subunit type 1 TsaE [bacterium]|jgi:tRNA threonylcarbamoyladenosine biosynthesis protein TsaE|nr:tRNA (adenosine(37)-N6)-threonylcarbamoyltransferase complex ATPase subunit type 1 TsaE [bacterium]